MLAPGDAKPGGKVVLNYRARSPQDVVLLPLGAATRALFRIPKFGSWLSQRRLAARLGWLANRLQPDELIGPLSPLPNDHALYSAFFTFEDGPPTTSPELNGWGDNLIHEHLFAVQRDNRIRVLYSNKDYSSEWNFHPDNKRFLSVDPTRFAVNLIVYALTH